MEQNQQPQLSIETCQGIIQELNMIIANLNLDLALARTQNKELIHYAKELEAKCNEIEHNLEAALEAKAEEVK